MKVVQNLTLVKEQSVFCIDAFDFDEYFEIGLGIDCEEGLVEDAPIYSFNYFVILAYLFNLNHLKDVFDNKLSIEIIEVCPLKICLASEEFNNVISAHKNFCSYLFGFLQLMLSSLIIMLLPAIVMP